MKIEWTHEVPAEGKCREWNSAWDVGPFRLTGWVAELLDDDILACGSVWVSALDDDTADIDVTSITTTDARDIAEAKALSVEYAQELIAPYAAMMLKYAATVDPSEWSEELRRAAKAWWDVLDYI